MISLQPDLVSRPGQYTGRACIDQSNPKATKLAMRSSVKAAVDFSGLLRARLIS